MIENEIAPHYFVFCGETRLACTKILSFFGKCALTQTNAIPLSGFPTRGKEKHYPVSENPTGEKRGFLHKNSLGFPANRFYLLKHIIKKRVNHNLYIRREIRREIKKFFIDPGKRFSGSISCFFIGYR